MIRYSLDSMHQLLLDMLTHLPFTTHPSLLAPSVQLLIFLFNSHLVMSSVIVSFLHRCLSQLSSLNDSWSVSFVEILSSLAVNLILTDFAGALTCKTAGLQVFLLLKAFLPAEYSAVIYLLNFDFPCLNICRKLLFYVFFNFEVSVVFVHKPQSKHNSRAYNPECADTCSDVFEN